MSAQQTPFFCSDCDGELSAATGYVRKKDGRVICGRCERKLQEKRQQQAQPDLFIEQKSLFNPHTRRRNVEGFSDAYGFHPIRASKDYNEFLAGDYDTDRQRRKRQTRQESKKREQYREEEEFYRKQEKRERRGSGVKAEKERSLASFVRRVGGIVPGGNFAGEIRRLGYKETGTTGLINKNARQGSHKQSAEWVMDLANQDGFRDKDGGRFTSIGSFLLAVEDSAVKGISKTRRRGPTKRERDRAIMAKATRNPIVYVVEARRPGQGWSPVTHVNRKTRRWVPTVFKSRASADRIARKIVKQDRKYETRIVELAQNPGMFDAEARSQAKLVQRTRPVQAKAGGERGVITGAGPDGWLKVQWDNRAKPTLIKRSELKLARGLRSLRNPIAITRCTSCGQVYGQATECPMCRAGVGRARRNPKPSRARVIAATKGALRGAAGTSAAQRARQATLKARVKRAQTATVGPKGKLPNPAHYHVEDANTNERYESGSKAQMLRGIKVLRKEFPTVRFEIVFTPTQKRHVDWRKMVIVRRNPRGARGSRDAFGVWHPNPSVADIAKKFQGGVDGSVEELHAASSAPANLARAGKLVFLKVGSKTFKLPGAMVAIAPNEKLWIVSDHAPVFETKAKRGEGLDVGEVTHICYETAKTHIGEGKAYEYVHEFGEDGGKRPHLVIDADGMPILRGGDYKIRAEGIVD